jgi:hypothetical protein
MARRPGSRYADSNNVEIGDQENPFDNDHHKYRFEVAEVAMGSMDGAHLKFYEVGLPLSRCNES